MVFRSGSGFVPEASNNNNTTTTGPVVEPSGSASASASASASSAAITRSPQLLHHFTLPDNLKWSSFNHSPHRFRKLSLADSLSPPVAADAAAAAAAARQMVRGCDRDQDQDRAQPDEEVSSERKSNKILLRLSNKSKVGGVEARAGEAAAAEPPAVAVAVADGDGESEFDAPKTWNFRPRKPLVKKKQPQQQAGAVANVPKDGRGGAEVNKQAQGKPNGEKQKKENKQKLCISLSRQEIEEDIFAMTGSKPSRRPKKRAKAVQKHLDCVFPGLWLYSISIDAYTVPDPPLKI